MRLPSDKEIAEAIALFESLPPFALLPFLLKGLALLAEKWEEPQTSLTIGKSFDCGDQLGRMAELAAAEDKSGKIVITITMHAPGAEVAA